MAKKRTYQDDDGRTIADMSGVGPSPMLFPRVPKKKATPQEPSPADDRPWESQEQFTPEQRRAAMGGEGGHAHRRRVHCRRRRGDSGHAAHLESLKKEHSGIDRCVLFCTVAAAVRRKVIRGGCFGTWGLSIRELCLPEGGLFSYRGIFGDEPSYK